MFADPDLAVRRRNEERLRATVLRYVRFPDGFDWNTVDKSWPSLIWHSKVLLDTSTGDWADSQILRSSSIVLSMASRFGRVRRQIVICEVQCPIFCSTPGQRFLQPQSGCRSGMRRVGGQQGLRSVPCCQGRGSPSGPAEAMMMMKSFHSYRMLEI